MFCWRHHISKTEINVLTEDCKSDWLLFERSCYFFSASKGVLLILFCNIDIFNVRITIVFHIYSVLPS